jgi:hypothetical protein
MIASDEDVGVAGNGSGDDPAIGGVSNLAGRGSVGLGNNGKRREDRIDGVEAISWDLEFGSQNASEFTENDVADDKIVFSEDGPKHIGAEAAGGEGGDQDVGVETDSHETVSKISSSVR